MASTGSLFTPLRVGGKQLQHRVVMSPLTRFRNDDKHVSLDFVTEYYSQRASVPGTFIVTEATAVSPQAGGYKSIPGIWSDEQVAGWKRTVDAVHAKGSFITLQLWAIGRVAEPAVLREEGGNDLVSASDVPVSPDATKPRPLTEAEIQQIVADFGRGAKNAIERAGFDLVEIHAANGYLINQFLADSSNKRTDRYGGSVENRSRFALEVAKSVADAVGPDKVGIRLSPFSTWQNVAMSDHEAQFSHTIGELAKLKLAYLHLMENRREDLVNLEPLSALEFAFKAWGNTNPVFVAGGWEPKTAIEATNSIYKDRNVAIVFGRHFLANPDLPYRIKHGLPLNEWRKPLFYAPRTKEGYIDYPFSTEFLAESKA